MEEKKPTEKPKEDAMEKLKELNKKAQYVEIKVKDTSIADCFISELLKVKRKQEKQHTDMIRIYKRMLILEKFVENQTNQAINTANQNSVDISTSVSIERYNEHTEEINNTLFNSIQFKIGSFAIVKLKKKVLN